MSNLLTAAQIAYYAQAAGFTGQDLVTAVAIALAESSGNANAYNPESGAGAPAGQGSYGLWQIFLAAHPEYAGANLYDPQTNANAAYAIYSAAGGFSPWATFNSSAYEAYLGPAQTAAPAAFSVGGLQVQPAPGSLALPGMAPIVTPAFNWQTILLGLGIVAGITLVIEIDS